MFILKSIAMTTETQNVQILRHLLSGQSITAMEALVNYQCFRLASRVSNLRNDGYNIETIMIQRGQKRFAKYILQQENV